MLTSDKIFEYLTNDSNIIWREDTRHEAMLLLCPFIRICSSSQYELLLDYFLKGPPNLGSENRDKAKDDSSIFELLNYIKIKCKKDLAENANNIFEALQVKGYQPDIDNPGIKAYLLSSEARPYIPEFPDLLSLDAMQVVTRVLEQEDTIRFDRRDICEQCGSLIVKDIEWGTSVLNAIRQRIDEFTGNQIGPLLWGIRTGLEDKEVNDDNNKYIGNLLDILHQIVQIRPSAEVWSSLPSVLEKIIDKFNIDDSAWLELAASLSTVYIDFDYDHGENTDEIRWLDRAINHPLGRITTIFLNYAQLAINQQAEDEIKYELPIESQNHFEEILGNYNVGSRYSLCILEQRFSWFEAVNKTWAHKYLEPFFHWGRNDEATLVSWSGYLWSNSFSKYLSDNYENMYLECVKRISDLGESEQSGLAKHISGIFWFGSAEIKLLKATISLSDASFISGVIDGWPSHLANSSDEVTEKFFVKIVEPIWAWMDMKGDLQVERGVLINDSLWHLLPYSKSRFPDVVPSALKTPLQRARDSHRMLDGMLKSNLAELYPLEFVRVMHQVLIADEHPEYNNDKWEEIWSLVSRQQSDEAVEFRDLLERRRLIQ